MLCIHIGSITETGLDIDEQVDPNSLPMLKAVARDSGIEFDHPVRVSIHAASSGETILLDGTVATAVLLPCSRCLKRFNLTLQTEFSATAVPEPASQAPVSAEDEIELDTVDMDVIAYAGNSIDLREEIAQQIIMALPFNPVCAPSCKGLCSHCGADLNAADCRCTESDSANPFAALKTLSFPPKED
jgi:uncharacterized protein